MVATYRVCGDGGSMSKDYFQIFLMVCGALLGGAITHFSVIYVNIINNRANVYAEYLSIFYKGFMGETTDWVTYSTVEKKIMLYGSKKIINFMMDNNLFMGGNGKERFFEFKGNSPFHELVKLMRRNIYLSNRKINLPLTHMSGRSKHSTINE